MGPDAAELAAQHIDRLLADLRALPDPAAAIAAEELTRCLVQLYGTALARISDQLGPKRVAELCVDPLVESLLLVHDLHPVPAQERIRRALGRLPLRPELVGVDEAGVARVRLNGGGCQSSRGATLREIEAVVRQVAPEVTGVEVTTAPALLQLSPRPGR
ncbi:MAG: NifU family protein [Actinoplanes sp.]